MAKTNSIELPDCEPMTILYEDHPVITCGLGQNWSLRIGLGCGEMPDQC